MTPAALNTGNRNLFSAGREPDSQRHDTIDTAMGTDETLPPLLALPQSKSVTKKVDRLRLHSTSGHQIPVPLLQSPGMNFFLQMGIVRHLVCYNRHLHE
jgi:hypothetical protein